MDLEGYISTIRYMSARNKTGMIRVIADMLKDFPEVDIEEVIDKLYPPRGRR